jgi:hypothetical protein
MTLSKVYWIYKANKKKNEKNTKKEISPKEVHEVLNYDLPAHCMAISMFSSESICGDKKNSIVKRKLIKIDDNLCNTD